MKLFIFILLSLFTTEPVITRLAEEAFVKQEYKRAAGYFESVSGRWISLREPALYNAALAFRLSDSVSVSNQILLSLQKSGNNEIRSRSLNNYAVYLANNEKKEEALEMFKQALRDYPENEWARYNYELLKKRMPTPPPPQQDQQNEDQREKEKKSTPEPKSPKPTEQLGKVSQEVSVSKAEAERLMEDMQNQEKKFLQQLRKSVKGKPDKAGKPDW